MLSSSKQGLTKADRRAWWASLTPAQQEAYIQRKIEEKRILREAERLHAEFNESQSTKR